MWNYRKYYFPQISLHFPYEWIFSPSERCCCSLGLELRSSGRFLNHFKQHSLKNIVISKSKQLRHPCCVCGGSGLESQSIAMSLIRCKFMNMEFKNPILIKTKKYLLWLALYLFCCSDHITKMQQDYIMT